MVRNEHGGKREGAGRPAKFEDSERITLRLSAEAIAILKGLADKKGVSPAEWLNAWLLKRKP